MNALTQGRRAIAAFGIVAAMVFAVPALHAQITGEIEAKVPFEFTVDNTRLPAGDYVIRPVGEESITSLELVSANGKLGVLMAPMNAEANDVPKISELVFDRISNRYFLREIWVEGNQYGYSIEKSKVETRLERAAGAKSEQHRVTVKHHGKMSRKS